MGAAWGYAHDAFTMPPSGFTDHFDISLCVAKAKWLSKQRWVLDKPHPAELVWSMLGSRGVDHEGLPGVGVVGAGAGGKGQGRVLMLTMVVPRLFKYPFKYTDVRATL
jgi:hypothetical protein